MQIICLELFFEITKLMIYDIMAFKPSFIFRPTLPMYGLKAITKYHRLGGLLTNLFLTVLEVGKSKFKVLTVNGPTYSFIGSCLAIISHGGRGNEAL
jgi:hypothetical protein